MSLILKKNMINLNENKSSQNSDMLTKFIKGNFNILSKFLCTSLNSSIKICKFCQCLNLTDITLP